MDGTPWLELEIARTRKRGGGGGWGRLDGGYITVCSRLREEGRRAKRQE